MPLAADRLMSESARSLLAFLEGCRGPDGIIRRHSFHPEQLREWLGGIGILQWDAGRDDFLYRLFGTHLAQNLGRDLTGHTLAAWPPDLAQIMREQASVAVDRGVTGVAHYRSHVLKRSGVVENGLRIQEKMVVPMAYTDEGPLDSVLVYVGQELADIPELRSHMMATDVSCWCAGDRSVCPGCPLPLGT